MAHEQAEGPHEVVNLLGRDDVAINHSAGVAEGDGSAYGYKDLDSSKERSDEQIAQHHGIEGEDGGEKGGIGTTSVDSSAIIRTGADVSKCEYTRTWDTEMRKPTPGTDSLFFSVSSSQTSYLCETTTTHLSPCEFARSLGNQSALLLAMSRDPEADPSLLLLSPTSPAEASCSAPSSSSYNPS